MHPPLTLGGGRVLVCGEDTAAWDWDDWQALRGRCWQTKTALLTACACWKDNYAALSTAWFACEAVPLQGQVFGSNAVALVC